ncbi:MAG: peptidoglycan-binding protein, partial [Oscillospiraceae bacterium]|nr:peptidoglycan-binding protein [Oscillospiraceae bacterium]
MNKRKLGMAVAVVFLVNLFVFWLVMGAMEAGAAVYRQGSTGETVRQIQQRLKNWGYYAGRVDGIYGPKTAEAVRWFQRRNRLLVDGVTGRATLAALGMPAGAAASAAAPRPPDPARRAAG